ncbi:MAG TPA: hypothetical protein VM324_03910 [Egibacteraceae bacterium]|nr:hypothetical protein [Egibacteraceae bacterium]
MLRRVFFTAAGLGAGVALGIYAVRKVERTQQRLRPEAIAASAGDRAGALGSRVREALAAGRAAAAAREAELRAAYRVVEGGRDVPGWSADGPRAAQAPQWGATEQPPFSR